jgi:hypothetical protein
MAISKRTYRDGQAAIIADQNSTIQQHKSAISAREISISTNHNRTRNITERNSILLFLPETELRERVEPGRIHGDGAARYLSLLLLFFF